ncbi:uncharacterized protein LOC117181351 [Belonocnema kinseyi]|uniref:uncharacterized protein LOC117181351 n=1 Tax=Belonocnema kinseyi TaxID=2817044 RepID=UPI00143CDD72|nr:uncharacterized protein LOC117181351 [Belonocnema kinseyi]
MDGIEDKSFIKEEAIIKEETIIKEELDLDAWESTQEEETNRVLNSGSRFDLRENPENERRARNTGKEYMNRQGQRVPARSMKNSCTVSSRQPCHLDCARKLIPENRREKIFQYFWNLPDRFKKYEFICRHVRLIQPRKRKLNPSTSKMRNYSRFYFLPLGGKLVRVCRTTFTATLDINEQWLSTAFKKFGHLSSGLQLDESELELENVDQNSTEEFETKFLVGEPDPLDIEQAKDPDKDIFDPDESAIQMELVVYVQSEQDKLERMRKLAAERQQRYKARKRLEKINSDAIIASKNAIAAPADTITALKNAIHALTYERESSQQDKQERKRKLAAERQKRYKAKKRLEKINLEAITALENGITELANEGESCVQDKKERKRKLAAERQKRYKARKRLEKINSDAITALENAITVCKNEGESSKRLERTNSDLITTSASAITVQELPSQEPSSQDIADQSERELDDSQVETERRRAIEAGRPYVRCDGTIHPGRSVKKGCDYFCYYNCRTILEEQRQKIFRDFWSINERSEKYAYLSRLVEESESKTNIPSRRRLSRKYFFEINGEFRRVCHLMFTATLDINHFWIRQAVKHAGARVYVSVDDIEDDDIGPIL